VGDHVARPLAEKLRGKYATSMVVESKTGAGGRIAVEYVKRAAPDGLTILQIPSSPMTLYPNTYRKLNYDPLADFVPVTSTVNYAFVLTAGPGLPAEVKTVADYVKWAKAHPSQASYGLPAAGSALHFVGMMLQKASGTELTSVIRPRPGRAMRAFWKSVVARFGTRRDRTSCRAWRAASSRRCPVRRAAACSPSLG